MDTSGPLEFLAQTRENSVVGDLNVIRMMFYFN